MQEGEYFSTEIRKFSPPNDNIVQIFNCHSTSNYKGFCLLFLHDSCSKDFLTGFLSGFLNMTLFNVFEDINSSNHKDPLQSANFIKNARSLERIILFYYIFCNFICE